MSADQRLSFSTNEEAFNELAWLLISPEEPSVAAAEKSMQDITRVVTQRRIQSFVL